jgi:repressor LexA
MRPRQSDLIEGLTPKQFQVLRHIAAFHGNQCYSPTISELACQLSLSRSTVFGHLSELQRKSLLTTSPGRARSLRLTSRGRKLLSQTRGRDASPSEPGGAGIPLAGRVAAGLPVEAVENRDSLSLESCFGMGDGLFALQVAGESMIEEDIRPGDYVICRQTAVAQDGDLVVALLDEAEATLKRFYKEQERVRLEPANGGYEPVYSCNCRIQGVVVGLVRKL